jgi:hypothetical protein
MPDAPLFTIVVSTVNRGRHIVPTIEAALDQTFTEFELLVVGDGVTDDTLDHVPRTDPRIGVIGLPWNSGSQTAPNNVGIAAARGRYVAYLGNDDIWMPDHLAALAQLFEETRCDIAVSGCAYHGPPGTDLLQITGLFESPEDVRRHFFPPTSFAHRASLAAEIGGWRAPQTVSAPVDADFLLRAVDANARFASTTRVTAHKFAAGHRYLSYLAPSSAEQSEMLAAIRSGLMDGQACANLVDRAKAAGTFMIVVYPDFSLFPLGHFYHQIRSHRGTDRAATVALTKEVYVPQSMEPRALDWYGPERGGPGATDFRWSGPSLRPKLLIPYCGDVDARITLLLSSYDPAGVIKDIRLTLNDRAIVHLLRRGPHQVQLEFTGRLQRDGPSVVQIILPRSFCPAEVNGSQDKRTLGVMLTGFTIAPVSPASLIRESARVRQFQDNADTSAPSIQPDRGRVSRNEPCPCGSGKRFKHCHGRIV